MTRSLHQRIVRALVALAALASGAIALGCTSDVQGGDVQGGGEGGSGGSGGGGGGAQCALGDVRSCPGPNQQSVCIDTHGKTRWTNCCDPATRPDCSAVVCLNGPTSVAGLASAGCVDGTWSTSCDCPITPLVLSFEHAPVEFTATQASFAFDLTGRQQSVATDWPTAATPWLALDRDGDGRINDGGELFGSATRLADGELARNGFIALRELDSNGDGQLSEADEAWPRLLLWSDQDGDRVSRAGELAVIASRRLLSIDLGYTAQTRCDGRGNCEVERATFRYLDERGAPRTGDIVDVHLSPQ